MIKKRENMKKIKDKKGQTLIELALIIALLAVILLGITEFARAWFVKNSLKNAVRQGARVAAVTPVASFPTSSFTCTQAIINSCPNSNPIINAVCCQPGVRAGTSVTLTCMNASGNTISCNTISSGGAVKVTANLIDTDFFVVGGTYFEFLGLKIWPWEKSLNITVNASMRYE